MFLQFWIHQKWAQLRGYHSIWLIGRHQRMHTIAQFTLRATIKSALIFAFVTLDSPVLITCALVRTEFAYLPDINECNASPSPCDSNATCANTLGSFTCTCNSNFTGNGATCVGMECCQNYQVQTNAFSQHTIFQHWPSVQWQKARSSALAILAFLAMVSAA